MNPVRAGLVADPADYRHSTWGMLCGGGRHAFGVKLSDHLPPGWQDMITLDRPHDGEFDESLTNGDIITCLRVNLAKTAALEAGMDEAEMDEMVDEAKRKPRFALTVTRRVRHWSDGAIIGSKLFVKNMAAEFYGDERADKKRFDDSKAGLVSFRQLRAQL
jgi:hypothetical protein